MTSPQIEFLGTSVKQKMISILLQTHDNFPCKFQNVIERKPYRFKLKSYRDRMSPTQHRRLQQSCLSGRLFMFSKCYMTVHTVWNLPVTLRYHSPQFAQCISRHIYDCFDKANLKMSPFPKNILLPREIPPTIIHPHQDVTFLNLRGVWEGKLSPCRCINMEIHSYLVNNIFDMFIW